MSALPVTERTRPLLRARERRRFHRAPLRLSGRLQGGTETETPIESLDVSPGGARLSTATPPQEGDRAVVFLERIGRLEGHVVRSDAAANTFALQFKASARRREAIAEALILLLNEQHLSPEERASVRRGARYNTEGAVSLELETGETRACTLLDVSIVGASLRCEGARPPLGSWVQLGMSYGRVARYLEGGGFAIDFQPRQPGALSSKA